MHKKALITGASSGIGAELARLIASKKISLVLTGRNVTELHQVAEEASELGAPKVDYFPADLSTKDGIDAVAQAIEQEKPDLLINNAGFGMYGDVIKLSISQQQKIIDVNISALFELTAIAAKVFVENEIKGVIMNISSSAAFPPFPGFTVYSATKAFINQFTICLDYEMRSKGIRVLAACPGMVISKFRERAGGSPTILATSEIMTTEFAAKEIWWQIEKRKQIHVFNWRYRLMLRMARYIFPNSVVAGILHQNILAFSQNSEQE